MASPHVCGVTALMLENDRDASPAEIVSLLRSTAAQGKISGSNSAGNDGLLQTWVERAPTMSPRPSPSPTELVIDDLVDGVSSSPISLTTGQEKFYRFQNGQQYVECELSGSNGDADLYVGVGRMPSESSSDCSSTSSNSNEACTVEPSGDDVFVMAYAYDSFTSLTVTCSNVDEPTCPCLWWQFFCQIVLGCSP